MNYINNIFILILFILFIKTTINACVNGQQKCIDECKPGTGYTICSNNKTITMQISSSLSCIQNGTNIYTTDTCVNNIPICQEKYPDIGCNECISGDKRCVKPCGCNSGFELCDNGKWVYFTNPIGTICTQKNASDINFLLSCDGESYAKECPNGLSGNCNCQNEPKCINGYQRCISECSCGYGYEECIFGEWIKKTLPTGTVCSQYGNRIIEEFSCPEFGNQGSCSGKTKGNCSCSVNVTCINGNIKCEKECGCGNGMLTCANGKWLKQPLPEHTICVNNGSSIYTVASCPEYGGQGKCNGATIGECNCNLNYECFDGDQQCINQCNCGSGYKECVNGKYINMDLPDNTICYQNTSTSIILLPSCSDLGDQSLCIGRISGECQCSRDISCINGEQECIDECMCGNGYRECVNGKWISRPLSDGTVCAQNGTKIIEEFSCPEYGDQGKCSGRTNCQYCDGSVECVTGDQLCIDECRCGSGYKECIGSRWITRSLADGTICAQYGNRIIEEFSCSEEGSGGICEGKQYGNCNCNLPKCIEGEKRCVDQCQCGVGYQQCVDGDWLNIKVSNNELCYQLTSHNIILYNNTHLELCSSIAKGTCVSSLCTYIGSKCIDECNIGRGYEICNKLNGEKSIKYIDSNLICKQDELNKIKLLNINDKQCCIKKEIHNYNKGRYCIKSCVLGLGYNDCDYQNKCIEVPIPYNMVCIQKDINEIELFHEHNHNNNLCHGRIHKCPNIKSTVDLPEWLDHYIHRHDISHHHHNHNNHHYNLPPNIIPPKKDENYSIGCKYDGSFCYKTCQNSYYVCIDGIRISFDTAPGTLCYQKDSKSIEQVNIDDKLCQNNNIIEYPTINSNNTVISNNPVMNPSNIECGKLDGYYCQDECGIKKGYFYCENSKSLYFMQVPENTVCWQKEINSIVFVHSDESKGSTFGCADRIHS